MPAWWQSPHWDTTLFSCLLADVHMTDILHFRSKMLKARTGNGNTIFQEISSWQNWLVVSFVFYLNYVDCSEKQNFIHTDSYLRREPTLQVILHTSPNTTQVYQLFEINKNEKILICHGSISVSCWPLWSWWLHVT